MLQNIFSHFWQSTASLVPTTQNDIRTSKSGPNPQFFHFWLRNILRATMARTFSTSQLQKVLRTWCVMCILTWKCASRHNGVQFFISHLATWLRTRRFSEPTFRPSGATKHWNNAVFATLLAFRAPASSFFSLFLFSDLLPSALLCSDSSHLCFFICPYCRKFDF